MIQVLGIAWDEIIRFAFVFVRIGIIFAAVPFFSAEIVPRRITATIAFVLGLVLMPVVPPSPVRIEDINAIYVIFVLLHEFLIGLCLGLAINVIFAGVQIAGQLAGFQMGFAIANVIDPMTGVNAPITSNFLYIVAFLLFLTLDGHYILIKALVESFSVVPIGDILPREGYSYAVVIYSARMFVIALKIAAPIIGVLLLVNITFALTARAMPQMNVFLMSFPLIISVGLFFMAIVVKMMPLLFSGILKDAWEFMRACLRLF
ncbi:MAG: flagellar biosynthetic protein FliR [Deltaproteobacteria bacterium]|nr:flagellar biosynthetic protein FliR [Deltaproteobacteria bacterium]